MFKFQFLKYLIFLNTFFLFQMPEMLGVEEVNILNNSNVSDSLENKSDQVEYILDSGDVISINFENVPLYSKAYPIDREGYIDLPEINFLLVKNKTIPELEKILIEKYKAFIFNPNLKIKLEKPRPVIVTLRGEVNISGLFTLKNTRNSFTQNSQFTGNATISNRALSLIDQNRSKNSSEYFTPKLFDLISRSNGITSNADLSKVIVIRNNPEINGGGKVKTVVNLYNLIANGDQSQNIELRDGDDIFVSRSEEILINQLTALSSSNLTPNQISVFINGNVEKKGSRKLPAGISLYEAIAAAGEKSLKGNIEFIRLKKQGATEKRIIRFNKKSIKGSPNNPVLVNGDIIFVRKNIIGQTTQALSEYSSPFLKAYGLYRLFD